MTPSKRKKKTKTFKDIWLCDEFLHAQRAEASIPPLASLGVSAGKSSIDGAILACERGVDGASGNRCEKEKERREKKTKRFGIEKLRGSREEKKNRWILARQSSGRQKNKETGGPRTCIQTRHGVRARMVQVAGSDMASRPKSSKMVPGPSSPTRCCRCRTSKDPLRTK